MFLSTIRKCRQSETLQIERAVVTASFLKGYLSCSTIDIWGQITVWQELFYAVQDGQQDGLFLPTRCQ